MTIIWELKKKRSFQENFHSEYRRNNDKYQKDIDPERIDKFHNNYLDEDGVLWKQSRCHGCHIGCSVYIGSKDGKMVEIVPNPDEMTVLCDRMGVKGERMIRFHYHPDRINHALKRVGERGEGKWEKILVDQALDEIAQKLLELRGKYGPQCVSTAQGTYRSDHIWADRRFMALFGSPQNMIDPGHICVCWKFFNQEAIFGNALNVFPPVCGSETKTRFVSGMRPLEFFNSKSYPHQMLKQDLWGDTKKPYNLIVVDPCCTNIARAADVWLPIRPGTDTALKLGLANLMVQQKTYKEDFLRDWTTAPFLVRMDTGKLLRGPDVKGGGHYRNFIVWDSNREKAVLWESKKRRFTLDGEGVADVKAAVEGQYEVQLSDGKKVLCKTAFTLIVEHLANYPVEEVAEITNLPENKIREAARMLAESPVMFNPGRGDGDQSGNQINNMMAEIYLLCFTGDVGSPGGQEIANVGPHLNDVRVVQESELEGTEFTTKEQNKMFLHDYLDIFPLQSWKLMNLVTDLKKEYAGINRTLAHSLNAHPCLMWDAAITGKPYPLKALISWHTDVLTWAPNTKHVIEAFKAMELVVQFEYWMTPAAALADYVLPAADWMERPCFSSMEDVFSNVFAGDRAVQPEGDRRVDYDYFRGLGIRCGQKESWPWEKYEDVCAYRVERCGSTYDEVVEMGMIVDMPTEEVYKQLREDGKPAGWETASGRIEIYSTIYDEMDVPSLFPYREPPESPLSTPEVFKEYPFILSTGGRTQPFFHSDGRIPDIGTREMHPWPVFMINIDTARELGIRDSDWCWIETRRGRIRQRARCGNEVGQNVIIAQASWWYPEMPDNTLKGIYESSANMLTDDSLEASDPWVGGWANRNLLCKVYRCEKPPEWFDESKFAPIP
jgi:anaerobic selenocysteine-containing dehydrogenase